jgi:hypothetical protein
MEPRDRIRRSPLNIPRNRASTRIVVHPCPLLATRAIPPIVDAIVQIQRHGGEFLVSFVHTGDHPVDVLGAEEIDEWDVVDTLCDGEKEGVPVLNALA